MARKPLSAGEMLDSGDEFEALYSAHQPLIYRFMFWRTKDEMLAQDLTSSVFEKAWRRRGSFSGGSAKAWLYKIAHNTLIDYWRRKKDIAVEDPAIFDTQSPALSLADRLDQEQLIVELRCNLRRLPPGMRDVLDCRFIQGRSARQTAKRLGLSEANVRVIQYRALKKLRGYLQ